MIPSAPQGNAHTTRRVGSLIFAVLATLAAAYLLLEVGFEVWDYFAISHEPALKMAAGAGVFMILAGGLLFLAFQFVKYFVKKSITR